MINFCSFLVVGMIYGLHRIWKKCWIFSICWNWVFMVRTVRTLLNHLLLGTLFRDLNSKSKNTILAGFFSTLNLSEEGRCFKDLKISALVCWFLSLKFGKMSKMAFFWKWFFLHMYLLSVLVKVMGGHTGRW